MNWDMISALFDELEKIGAAPGSIVKNVGALLQAPIKGSVRLSVRSAPWSAAGTTSLGKVVGNAPVKIPVATQARWGNYLGMYRPV